MAILVIKIEDTQTLLLNEFFDYNGSCWAITRSRNEKGRECIALEDFYECTVRTEWIDDIPVVFVHEDRILGWYESARIYRQLHLVSAFMEGNVVAETGKARLLALNALTNTWDFDFKDACYLVIDEYDEHYEKLYQLIFESKAHTVEIRQEMVQGNYDGNKVRLAGGIGKKNQSATEAMVEYCLTQCSDLAYKAMNDQCRDIRDFKTLYQYAKEVTRLRTKAVDGWYYLALACEQMGKIREGMKAIEKAISYEPDGDDLLTLKGHLLFAMGKYMQAAACYQEAWEILPEDGYVICLGQAYFAAGQMDLAYKAYQKVSDPKLLEARGINLKDMEHRWPFVAIRSFFGKKNKA